MAEIVAGKDKPCPQDGCGGRLVVSFGKAPDGTDGFRVSCSECGFEPANPFEHYTLEQIEAKYVAHQLNSVF